MRFVFSPKELFVSFVRFVFKPHKELFVLSAGGKEETGEVIKF